MRTIKALAGGIAAIGIGIAAAGWKPEPGWKSVPYTSGFWKPRGNCNLRQWNSIPKSRAGFKGIEEIFERVRAKQFPDRPSRLKAKFICPTLAGWCEPSDDCPIYPVMAGGNLFLTDAELWTNAVFSLPYDIIATNGHQRTITDQSAIEEVEKWARLYWRGEDDLDFNELPEIIVQGSVVITGDPITSNWKNAMKPTTIGYPGNPVEISPELMKKYGISVSKALPQNVAARYKEVSDKILIPGPWVTRQLIEHEMLHRYWANRMSFGEKRQWKKLMKKYPTARDTLWMIYYGSMDGNKDVEEILADMVAKVDTGKKLGDVPDEVANFVRKIAAKDFDIPEIG